MTPTRALLLLFSSALLLGLAAFVRGPQPGRGSSGDRPAADSLDEAQVARLAATRIPLPAAHFEQSTGPDVASEELAAILGEAAALGLLNAASVEASRDGRLEADFVLLEGETYGQAGERLSAYGAELCALGDEARVRLVSTTGQDLGQVDLSLDGFVDLSSQDPALQAAARKRWSVESPLLLQRALAAD